MYSNFLKKVLKEKFGHDFKVRKIGADDYQIEYIDGVSDQEVDEFVSRYLYGYFDGMEDRYVYKSNKGGFARYIRVHREMSEETRKEIIEEIKKEYGDDIEQLSPDEQYKRFNRYLDQLIYKKFKERNITKKEVI